LNQRERRQRATFLLVAFIKRYLHNNVYRKRRIKREEEASRLLQRTIKGYLARHRIILKLANYKADKLEKYFKPIEIIMRSRL
jgi:hypothetical protein